MGLGSLLAAACLVVSPFPGPDRTAAQDIVSSQLRQGFGRNKVRYKDFDWYFIESEHLLLHYEPEFEDLAERAVEYLEEGYRHISEVMRHELSTKPPIVIFKSHYEFQQTNIIHAFLPPGVAGFAEPLRYRMVIPFNGDLDEFQNVLVHELMHIFQYDILNRGPVKSISNPIASPPTWIMEGIAEYGTQTMNTVDEMVLRDAILTDELIPLEVMNSSWNYLPNVYLAYKQSHSLMEYIAEHYGPEKIARLLRVWDRQTDTDKLLERLLEVDMKTLDERWSASMRKKYWPLLESRDYVSELAARVVGDDDFYQLYVSPSWSLSGDMVAVLSSDGVERHVDIIRLSTGRQVERITRGMRPGEYDDLTFGGGTVAWAPDGRTIAFVAKKGPKDRVLLWDLYHKKLTKALDFESLEVIESLDWAPDGRRLAFVGTGFGQSDIYYVDIDAGKLTQLTGTPQREDDPDWSPDGNRIAFSAKRDGQFDIRAYDLATGRTQSLITSPDDDLWPVWLPEGNKILFVSTREGISDLFVHHLEEDEEYRLTRTISGVLDPALSPDGREIVLTTYYHGRQELYRMDMPSWPEMRRQSEVLAARAEGRDPVDPTPHAVAEQTASPVLSSLGAASDPGGGLGEVVALADQKAASHRVITLARASSSFDPATDQSPPQTDDLTLVFGNAEPDSSEAVDSHHDATAALPRTPYTPKLEFDGISVQMGYYSGFLSGIAQLSMSDLLGNHSLSMFTDYVGSHETSNDFTFAVGYTYYGRRATYNAMVFNWNQYFNDTGNSYYLYRGQAVRPLIRSRQSGVLLDMTYPLDVYRRLELSYSFVDEQRERVFPVTEAIDGFSTHLTKAAYIHDSLNNGLLGPTAGRRYYLSAGRTMSLDREDRSFSHLEADYRHFIRLGRWSVLGLRGIGVGSLGRDGLEYNLGGPAWFLPFFPGYNLNVGPLRGYPFSEFAGTRVLLFNGEARVPFIRNITFGWPGTFSIPAVDGSFFVDIGGAWNEGESLDLWPLAIPETEPLPMAEPGDPPVTRQLRAGMGFGVLVYFLAPLNFEFARQTDFNQYSDWRMHFSFGKSF